MLQFAGDNTLVSHSNKLEKVMENLQNLIDTTTLWFNKWRLKPNPSKSHLIIFNHIPSNTSPTLTLYNHTLRPEISTKYLGVIFDNKINFNLHTSQVKKKIIARAKHFRSLTINNKGTNKRTASKIYKLICRPIIEYGHVLFLNCKNPAITKLKVAETSSLRAITKIRHPNNSAHNPPNQLLYQITQIQPIQHRLNLLSTRFAQNEENHRLLDKFCLRRNHNGRRRSNHPEHTVWERLRMLA